MSFSERAQRMIDSAPDYYQYSKVYTSMQQAVADELEARATDADDLKKQLRITTATWGLKYWEEKLKIPVNEAQSYDIRRSRVLSKWRGFGNFSADLIKVIAEVYSGGEVDVTVDVATYTITVKFIGARGIPENLDDLKNAVENVVHAHLGTVWAFTYLTFGELGTANRTFAQLAAEAMNFASFSTWKPV